jgi:hypothetical protein
MYKCRILRENPGSLETLQKKKARLLQKLEEGSYVNYKLAEIEIQLFA